MRQSEYEPRFCEMLISHMAQGFSFDSFGAEINKTRDTLYRWEKRYPEFKEAKQLGFVLCRKWWENLGRGGAAGKIKNFNAAVWIFNMKNRFAWKDRIEHSGEIDFSSTREKIDRISKNPDLHAAAMKVAEALAEDDE